MRKKDMVFYSLIILFAVLFLWQWVSKAAFSAQISQLQEQSNKLERYNQQLQLLSGIGPIGSTHIHADIKVYINGQPIDFSQKKYQLTTNFIHFEDGIGNAIHIHATGIEAGHLLRSVGINFNSDCLFIDGQSYCNEGSRKIKYYANGKLNRELYNYAMKDLDKILISYGDEDDSEMQKQLDSITNLAPKYSSGKSTV